MAKRHPTAHCTCGWSLWRAGGFTKREVQQAWQHHRRTECPETARARWT